jgi:hypothetical protein
MLSGVHLGHLLQQQFVVARCQVVNAFKAANLVKNIFAVYAKFAPLQVDARPLPINAAPMPTR